MVIPGSGNIQSENEVHLAACMSVSAHLRNVLMSSMYSVSQKSSPPKNFLRYFLSWSTCVTENYLSYCPNIYLRLCQFWSIYLNICVKCIIFTGETPQIVRLQFSCYEIQEFFIKNKSHQIN